MISIENINTFEKELNSIMNLQEQLLNIQENDIEKIEEIISKEFTTKLPLRRLLSVLSSLIYARPSNLYFYCQIISYLSPQLKAFFDSHEVSTLIDNKSALLVLLQSKVITSYSIIQKFNGSQFDINFFFPDIEKAKKPKNITTLQNDEYRFHGQNDDHIADIIRNDDVHSLNKEVKLNKSLLNSTVHSSRYETFDFVASFGKKPSLIEYSAFFGRAKTFKYLIESGSEITAILPEFAVAGGSIEIIHLLEECNRLTFGSECLQASVEFFQYELFDYFTSTNKIKHSIYELFESIKHFNYEIFIELIQNNELFCIENVYKCLFCSIEYQNIDALNFLLKLNIVDINVTNDFCNTPLIIAANHGFLDIFNALIDVKNVDVNKSNVDGV